jgi:hypothetical protein
LLKARVIIYSDNHHVRLLPPERLVVNQSLLGSREPTLLCHHLEWRFLIRTRSGPDAQVALYLWAMARGGVGMLGRDALSL